MFEGARSKTLPRKNFYSRTVTSSQVRQLNKAKLSMQKFDKTKCESSASMKDTTTKTEKSRSRKRKASFSSSSSSQSSGKMSVCLDNESSGTSRSSSSSSSLSSHSHSFSGSSFYGTAPVDHVGEQQQDVSRRTTRAMFCIVSILSIIYLYYLD